MTNHLPGSNEENFDCGNWRIEWRLTTTWGDDSPLCVFFLSGWGSARLILSLCLISPGQFPAVISIAPSTWKSKPLQKWNTIWGGRGGGVSLISPHLVHANNVPRQPTKSWEQTLPVVVKVDGWVSKVAQERCVRA